MPKQKCVPGCSCGRHNRRSPFKCPKCGRPMRSRGTPQYLEDSTIRKLMCSECKTVLHTQEKAITASLFKRALQLVRD